MRIIIVFLSGNDVGEEKEFISPIVTIGSSPLNDVVFDKQPDVSRNHVTIVYQNQSFVIYSHSFYFTYVDDNIIEKAELANNSIIKLGHMGPSFKFNYKSLVTEEENIKFNSNFKYNKRWYDSYPMISRSIELLKTLNSSDVIKVSEFLVSVFNYKGSNYQVYSPEELFVDPNIQVDQIISSLPNNNRWYDNNNSVREIIESLKVYKPEIREKIIIDIIKMIDCFNQV